MISRSPALRRSPRDRYAWMRNTLAALITLTTSVGAVTFLLHWQIVGFNFTLGMTLLAGIPMIMELLRTRPTPDQDAQNDAIMKDFERYFRN
jgi:hypothetical protein